MPADIFIVRHFRFIDFIFFILSLKTMRPTQCLFVEVHDLTYKMYV